MPTNAASNGTPRGDLMQSVQMSMMGFAPIAPLLFTPTPTPNIRGGFGKIPLSALFNTPDTKRRAKSGTNKSTWEYEELTYLCKTHAHGEISAAEDAAFFGQMIEKYQQVLAMRGMDIINRNMELRAMQALHNTTTFTGSTNTAAASVEWDTAATADPIGDVTNAMAKIRAKCGLTADTLQISWQAWRDLSKTAQIRGALQYTAMPDGVIPLDAIAGALGVKRVVVPANANVYNSAKSGQTPTLAEIWDKEYAFLAVTNPTGDIAAPCIGRLFYWEEAGGLMTVDQYYDDDLEADIFRAKQCVQEKVIGSEFGFLISNAHT